MSDFEIEIGKHGLEVEAKGKALFWIVTATFLTGLAVGVYVGYKGGHKIDKFKKRWCHGLYTCVHMNICIAYSFLRLLALWRQYMYCTCVYKHTHVSIHVSNVVRKCSALISCEEWILVNKGSFPSLIIFPSSKRERVNSSSFFRRGRKTGTQTSCAVWECVYKRVCGVLCDRLSMCPDLLVHIQLKFPFMWYVASNFIFCTIILFFLWINIFNVFIFVIVDVHVYES